MNTLRSNSVLFSNRYKKIFSHFISVTTLFTFSLLTAQSHASTELLNASYDVAREFYRAINPLFSAHYEKETGGKINVTQAHGGSSAQARAVSEGLPADVVTMNTSSDIDFLAHKGLVAKDWAQQFPHNAAPTTSTMLFLVRKGNPKNIQDWDDLLKPNVKVIVVNPKTGGNGRYAFLAAWGAVLEKGGSTADARAFVQKLYKNVPVLGKGGRDATGIFLQRNTGDVLITFESEVLSVERDFGKGQVDVIYPSSSVLAENPVAVVQPVVAKKGTSKVANAYLNYLYSDEAQDIAARHGLRPRSPSVLKRHTNQFKSIQLFSVKKYFGSLEQAQKDFFNDGAEFDKLYTLNR